MARLRSISFEKNSLTAGIEFVTAPSGTVSITTTTVRSGTYAGRANPTAGTGVFPVTTGALTGPIYCQFWVNFASFPAGLTRIFQNDTGNTDEGIRINSNGTLELWENSVPSQAGSDSSALSLNTWHRIGFEFTDSDNIKAFLDGTQFASYSNAGLNSNFNNPKFGILSSATADMNIDDIIINDGTGSYQNIMPTTNKLVMLRPSAEGDNQGWTPSSGTNNAAMVDEVTPNDDTDYVSTTTNGVIDDYDLPAGSTVGIGASDTINYVAVGVRGQRIETVTGDTITLRIKPASGGTVDTATAFDFNTSYETNDFGIANNEEVYPTLTNSSNYEKPGTANPWTPSDIDAAQIGISFAVTFVSGGSYRMSAIWLLVDFTPSSTIKTVNGLAKASVKTFNGLAIASVKTINGLS